MKSALENTLEYAIEVDKKAGFKDNAFLGEMLLHNSPNVSELVKKMSIINTKFQRSG